MAPGTGQQHDVFVSYAHADNEIPKGTSAEVGWVTALAHNLNTGPNVYKKKLFIDHQLRPGDVFSEDLFTKVENSALLVLLLSQNYIESEWCGKELDHFIRTHANDPDKPADVFVVELFPYESFIGVPPNVEKLRKRLIHAKFYHQPAHAASPVLAGYPTPAESGLKEHYWLVLNELRVAIDARLRAQRGMPAPRALSIPSVPDAVLSGRPVPVARLGTVLLADVTDDLEFQRNALRTALQAEGIVVLPEGDYVGLTPQEFDAEIRNDIKRSDLFVQLLSSTAGRKSKGFSAPLPQLQFEHAMAAKLPLMQWCEQLPQSGRIADPAHARLLETEFLRVVNLPAFQAEIVGWLVKKRDREKQAAAAPVLPAPVPGKKLIFVDDIASDVALSAKLRALIRSANCGIRSLPAGAPLRNNGIDIREALRPCRAGITFYADRSKVVTVYNRLVFFLNQIAEANLPLARWGVYLEQGTVASELGIESDDVVPLDESRLLSFLREL